jgi:hypothetical protein
LTTLSKQVVERTFASINTLFCQHVSGYTGRDVTRRGSDVDKRAVWSLPELQELFDEWVLCWQARPHEGLRHPFNPDQAASRLASLPVRGQATRQRRHGDEMALVEHGFIRPCVSRGQSRSLRTTSAFAAQCRGTTPVGTS